ncbi:MAG: rRNA maturation RNase YbeY [Anaerolineales bacterium]
MIHIEAEIPFPNDLLERAANAALGEDASQGPSTPELSIILTSDERLHELNLNYLGIDAPTDVLSFPASETDPETGARYIGDILISVPRAQAQAEAAGHPLEAELQLLVVHGILHLLGHDHAEAEEKARMWKAQAEILEGLGLGHIQIREE